MRRRNDQAPVRMHARAAVDEQDDGHGRIGIGEEADCLSEAILDDAGCLLREACHVRTSAVLDRHVQDHELRVRRKNRWLLPLNIDASGQRQ